MFISDGVYLDVAIDHQMANFYERQPMYELSEMLAIYSDLVALIVA